MNWNEIEAKWDQAKGKIKEQWGELTDDDLMQIDGKKDQLIGKLQERYAQKEEEAAAEVRAWMANNRLDEH